MDHGPFDSHNNEIGDKPAPAAAIAAAYLQHAEDVKNTAEPTTPASPFADSAVRPDSIEALQRLTAIAADIGENVDSELPPVLQHVPSELHAVLFDIMKAATRDRGILKNVVIEPETSDRIATVNGEKVEAPGKSGEAAC